MGVCCFVCLFKCSFFFFFFFLVDSTKLKKAVSFLSFVCVCVYVCVCVLRTEDSQIHTFS